MSALCKTEKQNIPSDPFTALMINYFLLSFFFQFIVISLCNRVEVL